ncbi:MAG: glutamate formimidoyltransferase [Dysgonamonadaceae bacterium]|jgi:glutamate formiminotransferase|nr:glutamate formimidoyltransferase [Dysgonamonadaceae bacterium]
MNPLVECVPNFSEGRNRDKIEKIVNPFRSRAGVKLLDYTADSDHNRMVITAIGKPEAMYNAVIEAVGIAVKEIDLRQHKGQHPRIGAADVIPFIPLRDMDLAAADALAKKTAESIARQYDLPVYLYEYSASAEHRRNLASVRKGNFEGLSEKMQLAGWQPDFCTAKPHQTAGATVVGARKPLIAFNINLDSDKLEIAQAIARNIRFSNGGLPAVKALGLKLETQNCVQVSVNLTDYTQTSIYQVVETIRTEAAKYGVNIKGSELIGLLPLQALTDTAAAYLGLQNFSVSQVLETHL